MHHHTWIRPLALTLVLSYAVSARADVVYSGFGPNDTYYKNGSRSATTSPRGNPPTDADVAQAFHIGGDTDLSLTSIDLAVRLAAGQNRLDVWLVGNRPTSQQAFGEPDEVILESFRFEDAMTSASGGSIIHADSSLRPILRSGWDYWLVLSVPDPATEVQLFVASLDLPYSPQWIGERFSFNQNQWEVAFASDGYAFRIEANLIPLPSTLTLSLLAIASIFVTFTRRVDG